MYSTVIFFLLHSPSQRHSPSPLKTNINIVQQRKPLQTISQVRGFHMIRVSERLEPACVGEEWREMEIVKASSMLSVVDWWPLWSRGWSWCRSCCRRRRFQCRPPGDRPRASRGTPNQGQRRAPRPSRSSRASAPPRRRYPGPCTTIRS